MKIGIFEGAAGQARTPSAVVDDIAAAHRDGFSSYWLTHMPVGPDALTNLVVAGQTVPDIELGTGVVPMWTRHPLALVQQALTTNVLIGGRLSLGVGLAHQRVVESTWGLKFERPVRFAREYLTILEAALRNETIDVSGEIVSGRSRPLLPAAPAPRLYLAALGEQMLQIAGTVADGTVLWMTGPKTIAEHILPAIRGAAASAARPQPRVLAAVPVMCTDDEATGRELAARVYKIYASLPSYRATLDLEGYATPSDAAIVGNEHTVAVRLRQFFASGADDILCSIFGPDDASTTRTRQCLAALV